MTAASRDPAVSGSLTTLSAELPVYTGYVEDGEIYNSLGYPAGASFIQVASEEMHLRLLPAARTVYAHENARLTAASAQATGLPLAVVTLAAGLALGFFLYRLQRWLSRRTHRTLNVGLLAASWPAWWHWPGWPSRCSAAERTCCVPPGTARGPPRRSPRPTSPRCRPGATRP